MQVTTLNPDNCSHIYYRRLLQGENPLNRSLHFNELIQTLRMEGDNPPTANFKLHVYSLINRYKHENFKKLEDCTLLFHYCQRYQIPLWNQRDCGYGGYHYFPNSPVILGGDLPMLSALEVSINRNETINPTEYPLERCFELAMACGRWNIVKHLIEHFRYEMHICELVGGKSWPYLTVPCRSGDLEGVRIFLDGAALTGYHFNRWNYPPKEVQKLNHRKDRYISIEDHPIVAACQSGNVEVLKLLLEKGFTLHEDQRIPAMKAALSSGSLATLQRLFQLMDPGTTQALIQGNSTDFIKIAFSSNDIGVIQFLVDSIPQQDRERLLRAADVKLLNKNLLVDMLLLRNGFLTKEELRKYFVEAAAQKLGILEMQLLRSQEGFTVDNDLILEAIKNCCVNFSSNATKKNISFLMELFKK